MVCVAIGLVAAVMNRLVMHGLVLNKLQKDHVVLEKSGVAQLQFHSLGVIGVPLGKLRR